MKYLYVIVYHASDNEYESDWTHVIAESMDQTQAEQVAYKHLADNYGIEVKEAIETGLDNCWYDRIDQVDGYKISVSTDPIKQRLEYLRQQIRNENISYGELSELQSLADHIEDGDNELLEPAGVPEGTR